MTFHKLPRDDIQKQHVLAFLTFFLKKDGRPLQQNDDFIDPIILSKTDHRANHCYFQVFYVMNFHSGEYFSSRPSFHLSYFRHCTQFFRGYHSRVAWMFSWRVCLCRLVSFRFKAKGNLQCCGDVVFVILITSKNLRLSVCFNTFRNFNRSLIKRLVSHTQTITE